MPLPHALFRNTPADLRAIGLASKLPTLVRRIQDVLSSEGEDASLMPLLGKVEVLRAMGPAAAHAVDKALVQERAFDLVEHLIEAGTFTFTPELATRGFASFTPLRDGGTGTWAFANRHGTIRSLLKDHIAFRLADAAGWSFFGQWASADPAGFFAATGHTPSGHLEGGWDVPDRDIDVYGRGVLGLFAGLAWHDRHPPAPGATLQGPGWSLSNAVAMQVAVLAGWDLGVVAQAWDRFTSTPTPRSIVEAMDHKVWARHLATAHGRMLLASRLAALDTPARQLAAGVLWRGYSARRHGKTLPHTPATNLHDLFCGV